MQEALHWLELAENPKLPVDVTLVEMADRYAPIDYDMAVEVHKHIQSKGVWNPSHAQSIHETDAGLSLTLQKTAPPKSTQLTFSNGNRCAPRANLQRMPASRLIPKVPSSPMIT